MIDKTVPHLWQRYAQPLIGDKHTLYRYLWANDRVIIFQLSLRTAVYCLSTKANCCLMLDGNICRCCNFCVSRVSILMCQCFMSHLLCQNLLIETPPQLIADVHTNRSIKRGVRGEKGSLGCENLLIPTPICLAGSPLSSQFNLGSFSFASGKASDMMRSLSQIY